MNNYIVTCDKTAWILNTTIHLYNKYCDSMFDICTPIILGFTERPKTLDNCIFMSIKDKQETIQTWTRDLYNVIKEDKNEFCIFSLDDYLPIDYFNKDIYEKVFKLMESNENIVRYEFSYGASQKKEIEIIENHDTFKIFKLAQTAPYRISCQISLWRTKHLLSYLNNDWTPWEFEIKGSKLAYNDGKEVIGTLENHCMRYIEESALSNRHPGWINVLGLKHKDREELIKLGYIDENKIQYGMAKGDNPKEFDINKIGMKYLKFYR